MKTIIFDIGNVLVDFAWRPFFASFGLNEQQIDELAKATVFSKDWVQYDIGYLTDDEILELFCKNIPDYKDVLHDIFKDWGDMILKRDYATNWVKDLKAQGYQVLYLSNFSDKAVRECSAALEFIPYTDGGIFSYLVHYVKPQPEIYQLIIDTYNLTPSECVFIDDTKINLTAAEEFGINTIHFESFEQVCEDLEKLGIHTHI